MNEQGAPHDSPASRHERIEESEADAYRESAVIFWICGVRLIFILTAVSGGADSVQGWGKALMTMS